MGKWRAVRTPLSAGLLSGLLILLMPLLWVRGPSPEGPEPVLPANPAPVAEPDASPALPAAVRDGERTVRVLMSDGTVEEQSMADYLWSVVAAEMPASFEPEALRAQAVCARTYTIWKTANSARHKDVDADICADSSCCQAYITKAAAADRWGALAAEYTAKIAAAVADTDGVAAVYDGQPIQAVFFSSASGATEDAEAVWGNSLPYLTSVDSPEGDEVPNYHSQVTLTAEEAKTLILAKYPGAQLSGGPEAWFSDPVYTASGRVASMEIGGVSLSGGAVRTLFSLRSAAFQIETDDASITFSVTGYGHGVGLSQYGANAMAKDGSGWREIVEHYYTGVTLEELQAQPAERTSQQPSDQPSQQPDQQ